MYLCVCSVLSGENMKYAYIFIGNTGDHLKIADVEKHCNDLQISRHYRFATCCKRGSTLKPATPGCLADLPEASTLYAAFVPAPDGKRILARSNPFPSGPSRHGAVRTFAMQMRACFAPTVWQPPHDHGPDTLITVEDLAWFIRLLGIWRSFRLVIRRDWTATPSFVSATPSRPTIAFW
jgi:hypothetical protein